MSDPLPKPAFDALMERAGLHDIPPEEREEIRLATRHVAAFAARIRTPAPPGLDTEPATVFIPGEVAR